MYASYTFSNSHDWNLKTILNDKVVLAVSYFIKRNKYIKFINNTGII